MRISHRLRFSPRKSDFVSLEQARREVYLPRRPSRYSYSSDSVGESSFWPGSQEYPAVRPVRPVRGKVGINRGLGEL